MGGNEPPRLEGYTQGDEETTPEVFEVSGSVKWFDPSKGYGFIVPDEDLPDVLLHVTCLRHGGFQTASEGTRVVCEVVKSSRGLQAVRICSMDDSSGIRPSQLPQRTHVGHERVGRLALRSLHADRRAIHVYRYARRNRDRLLSNTRH